MQELDNILTEKEKEYLGYVLKPFKNEVISIKKYSYGQYNECIYIDLENDVMEFPLFVKDTMYKGMQLNKKYTLEELGLFTE